MRKQPALTFEGALRILGKHDPAAVGKLDKILGGLILSAGVAGAVAVPALAPLALLWGWVDQKNEAIGLLRGLVRKLSPKLAGVRGLERRELVTAAHTAIAVAAYFEVFEETVGKKVMKSFAITPEERTYLSSPTGSRYLTSHLYENDIPAPAVLGFDDNLHLLTTWYVELHARCLDYLGGIEAWPHGRHLASETFVPKVARRYQSHYIDLAAQVPEFLIWASLAEHTATRTRIENLDAAMATAFDAHRGALSRVESLLGLVADNQAQISDLRSILRRANQGVLTQPVVPHDAERYDTDVTFPAIQDIFISPRYRLAYGDRHARPADERWWQELPVFTDLDLMLAGHLTSARSTVAPLVVLGHPGAGKSLLTKVLAARLPPADYTVVRVPLRNVGAHLPIVAQVQEALDAATHRRIGWPELTDQSAETVRVVLLDGLDELLQAAQFDRSGYLQEIAEFQRIEAEQDRPVAVIVTTRTVVADRVDTTGATMVKLEDFDERQMADWLQVWHATNRAAIASGAVRCLTVEEAQWQADLARQPLLLLMLALYAADPESPKLDMDLSRAALYERIVDNFARREVAKQGVSPKDFDSRVQEQITRLSITALAMFNRGAQNLREKDLQLDLEAIGGAAEGSDDGKRLLGEFFFVHAAEATLLSGSRKQVERSYEFLHATLGEFLVARHIMNVLRDVADGAYGGRRGARDPEDDLLYAILSHQAIAARESIAIYTVDLFFEIDPDEQRNVLKTLTALIDSYQRRVGSRKYGGYRPLPQNHVRELAAYSANLVCLAVNFGLYQVSGDLFLTEQDEALRTWRSTVALWRAGLDEDAALAMVSLVQLDTDGRLHAQSALGADASGVLEARATGDRDRARRERFGLAVLEGMTFYDRTEWADAMVSWIIPVTAGVPASEFLVPPPEGTSDEDIAQVKDLLQTLIRGTPASEEQAGEWVEYLLDLPSRTPLDVGMVLSLACLHPEIVRKHPQLLDHDHHLTRLLRSVLDRAQISPEEFRELIWQLMGGITSPFTPPSVRYPGTTKPQH